MRIVLLLIASSIFNLVNVTTGFSQKIPVIKSAVKKSYNGSDVSCKNSNDAEITVTAAGGSGVYEYSKNNGSSFQNSNVLTNLPGGANAIIKVRDANAKNNVSEASYIWISNIESVVVNTFQRDTYYNGGGDGVSCANSYDGRIKIKAHGGTAPYYYSIDNGATFIGPFPSEREAYFENLPVGNYTGIAKDANGCTGTFASKVIMLAPKPITVKLITLINATCNNALGSITLKGEGSTGDYKASIDGNPYVEIKNNTNYTFSNLTIGGHKIVIKDNGKGCEGIYNFEIKPFLTATISAKEQICQGENASLLINIQRQEGISNSNDTYDVAYQDNNGEYYKVRDLVKGDNVISIGQLASSKSFTLVSVISTSGCVATLSGTANITVNPSGTWLGLSTDWHDPKNWTCGKVPTNATNVTIGQTKNDPVIEKQIAFANDLSIENAHSLKILDTLQVSGKIKSTGSLDATAGSVEFKGKNVQFISGAMFKDKNMANLVISNSAGLDINKKVGDTLNITESLTFGTTTASLNTSDNITLKSTINGTASIGFVHPDNRISGKFIVERYINTGIDKSLGQHGKAWLHLATPTIGSTIYESWQEGSKATGKTPIVNNQKGYGVLLTTSHNNVPTNGFDLYTGAGSSMKVFNSVTGTYDAGPKSTNEPIYNENGYMVMVRGDRSVFTSNAAAIPVVLRTKGEIITGNTKEIKIQANKYASIGNPYASKIYLAHIQMSGVDNFIMIWDPKLGGTYSLGGFQTLYKMGKEYYAFPGGGSYGNGPISSLESGQGFFVQTTKTEGKVFFTEEAKIAPVRNNNQRMAGTQESTSSLRTSLYALGSGEAVLTDGNLLLTSDSFNNDVDGMDARKMANSAENISILSSGTSLTIESRQTITTNDTIFFHITGLRAQNYRLELIAEKLGTAGMEAWLEDSFLKTKTPLNLDDSNIVEFAATSQPGAAASNRFMIVFRPAFVLPVTFTGIKATKNNEGVLVEWKIENEISLAHYEIERSADGLNFSKIGQIAVNSKGSGKYEMQDNRAGTGNLYFRIKSLDLDGKFSYSTIAKVMMTQATGSISVYPNPVTTGQVNLQLNNQEAGVYSLRLITPVGQVLFAKKINHSGGNYTEKIDWDYQIPRGIYQLEVNSEKGETKIIRIAY